MAADKYGKYYWEVVIDFKKNYSLYIMADEAIITNNGDLILKNEKFITGSFAKGTWQCLFAASVIDGARIAVGSMYLG